MYSCFHIAPHSLITLVSSCTICGCFNTVNSVGLKYKKLITYFPFKNLEFNKPKFFNNVIHDVNKFLWKYSVC